MLWIRGESLRFRHSGQVEDVVNGASFEIASGARIGLVGRNGCGKSTLLDLLRGAILPAAGHLYRRPGLRVGYLPQEVTAVPSWGMSAREYLWSIRPDLLSLRRRMEQAEAEKSVAFGDLVSDFHARGGYQFAAECDRVLALFGLNDEVFKPDLQNLSGGEKTKLAFARLLLEGPDLLLLDEPTNHLEIRMLEWLEEYLRGQALPFLAVSHDQRFLDNCVETIWEMKDGVIKTYPGRYAAYRQAREDEHESRVHRYREHTKKITQLKRDLERRKQWASSHQAQTGANGYAPVYESVTNFARKAAKRAKNLERRIERMVEAEETKKPFIEKRRSVSLDGVAVPGPFVLQANDLGVRFGDRWIFRHFSLALPPNGRLGVIGRIGSGKSTLLRLLTGRLAVAEGTFIEGTVRWTPQASIAWYAQELEDLREDSTILDEVLQGCRPEETRARTVLGCLGLRGDKVQERIRNLSAGERGKTALARAIFSRAHVLVLDEPTNHLDLPAREAFEEALSGFAGALLLASHDRHLLERVTEETITMSLE